MSKILNKRYYRPCRYLIIVMLLLTTGQCFAQYTAKRTVDGKTVTIQTSDNYIYDRGDRTYTGVSLAVRYVAAPQAKPVYVLDMVYTSTSTIKCKTISFFAADSTQTISAELVDDGNKYVDNKAFTSNRYHINITDNMLLFFYKDPIKRVVLRDDHDQVIPTPPVEDTGFLLQQVKCIQNLLKRKIIYKKPTAAKRPSGTRSY